VFVHNSDVNGALVFLFEGVRVEFNTEHTFKGLKAREVKVIKRSKPVELNGLSESEMESIGLFH
jgi:hypothetical protein